MITAKLPYPPTNNLYWRHARGRHYIDAPGLTFRKAVWVSLRSQGIRALRISAPVSISVIACAPDFRYRDVDNLPKALFDSLKNAEFYLDDSQIIKMGVEWIAPQPGNGHVVIEVEVIDPPPDWWEQRRASKERRRNLKLKMTGR